MEIDELIMKDLAIYGQDNPCPKSLTVVEGEFFRHYELGSIYGFCIYNQIVDGEPWFGIMSLEEDDEFWFIPSHPMNMSSFWCNAVNETWQRVVKWYNEYLFEGWKDNASFGDSRTWVCEVKKTIVPEVIMSEGLPDNSMFNTKYFQTLDDHD